MPVRLKLLIAANTALAIVPVAISLTDGELTFLLPWTVLLFGVSRAPLMLLSFWAGMGTSKFAWRCLGALLGSLYLAAPMTTYWTYKAIETGESIWLFFAEETFYPLECFVLAGSFLVVRTWFADVCLVDDLDKTKAQTPPQFSILALLAIVSLVAIMLAAARGVGMFARTTDTIGPLLLARALLEIVQIVPIAICAAWATLARGRILVRVVLATVVPAVLATAFVLGWDAGVPDFDWRDLPLQALDAVLSAVITIASLVVVRSCGYRLMPKVKL